MRILITGGAGFIGSNLANYHLKKNDEVIVIDDLSTGTKSNIAAFENHKNFTFHHQDLTIWQSLGDVLEKVDRIYHLAAMVGMFNVIEHPIKTLKVNINATMRLYDLLIAKKLSPTVIFASTSEVYGNQYQEIAEACALFTESTEKTQASYAVSKMAGEVIGLSYYESSQIPCIVLRIFNTIGMNQSPAYGMVVPRFINQALKNQDITVFGDGQQKRSFCDVRDLIRLMVGIADIPAAAGKIFNCGQKQAISIMNLAHLIKEIAGSTSKIVCVPFEEVYSNEYIYIENRVPNLEKILNLINYSYEWTLEKTLKDLIDHARKTL
ncbi:NAD-dependent epimerase/dehydratase (plasmid) [Legionella adelaidensis]|uniref:NAD-dependent epimerase/dehydratase n=1 Tax=Legionella adelaidensis TaxID=45056 RepID=A0A0W0R5H4_9GAMM|nr:NAD-dependent epimerase/dehydratase family protein [Legionella adelaidensis]KTC66312.1 NAD-dependent epimerase/dehydratase [Legionella adelaidensis]VEH84908.1 NAD-dependent epimerase/dehydratase [Legionella adelaidensis]